MKTTLDLPDELIREVKLRAVVQGRTVKDLVAEILRQGLGIAPPRQPEKPPAGSLVEIGESGLPVIRCRPDASATRMNVVDLLKIEQEAQAEEDSKNAGLSF
jgi:plasmid stability protein